MSWAREGTGVDVAGIIGMDFLWQRILRLDFDRGEVACLRGIPKGSGEPLPLDRLPRGPAVTLEISGLGRLPFTIDTGCTGQGTIEAGHFATMVDGAHAAHVTTARVASAGGVSSRRGALAAGVALGDFRHCDVLFYEGESNLLGLEYLSRYVVTFDFPGKRMYLRPSARHNNPSHWDLSGANLSRKDGCTVVSFVLPGSAAERAGLAVGDLIEMIDSRRTSGRTLWDICRPLREPGTHTLCVERGNHTIDLTLLLERPESTAAAAPAAKATTEVTKGKRR